MTEETSRDQTLQDFQDCTGLEDMEECIHILDEHEWNLMNAIQSVHERIGGNNNNEQESTVPVQVLPNRNKRQTDSNDFDDFDELRIIKTIPGSQRGIARDLHFTVRYNDRVEIIVASENETVYQLRLKIAEKFSIPPEKQTFLDWMLKSYDDRTVLKDLHLDRENQIHLTSIEPNLTTTTTTSVQSSIEIPLTITSKNKQRHVQTHKLRVPSNITIANLKKEIEKLTEIPVKEQTWKGLDGADDSKHLHETSITSNSKLHVQPVEFSIVSVVNLDDDQMDVETIDDEITVLTPTTSGPGPISHREPLIPDDCPDDFTALEHFQQVFYKRYGSPGPDLYMGPLDQAIKDSLHKEIRERRPLAIYLHHDNSICSNVFCSQVLSAEFIIQYLATNYIFWAWDVTSSMNKTKLIETLRRCIGNQGAQSVNEFDDDVFPLLLIVSRARGALELVNIIEGKSTANEVLSNLIQSHDAFEQQRARDLDEERAREGREELKRQQEDEYEQSRKADLAKERARQEEHDANERLKQEKLQLQEECKKRLPDEPNETEKNLTTLKIRLPDDEGVLIRRFRITENLQVLFDYLASEGRMVGEYKLLTTYPKRDLTSDDPTQTFEQLKLYPQEQLILEIL